MRNRKHANVFIVQADGIHEDGQHHSSVCGLVPTVEPENMWMLGNAAQPGYHFPWRNITRQFTFKSLLTIVC